MRSAPMTCTPTVTVWITVRIMRATKRTVRGAEPAASDRVETPGCCLGTN